MNTQVYPVISLFPATEKKIALPFGHVSPRVPAMIDRASTGDLEDNIGESITAGMPGTKGGGMKKGLQTQPFLK
jgi:hypothetical protein